MTGKLFSLLHELAHVFIGKNSLYNQAIGKNESKEKEEVFCNALAAELLVPIELFISSWQSLEAGIEEKIALISKKFTCSRLVIARRALDSRYINQKQYDELIAIFRKEYIDLKQEKKSSGGDFYNTMQARYDHRFLRLLALSASEGSTNYRDAYKLTHTNRSSFDKLIETIGR